jgi:ABC-2 type transport system permease protein
MIFAVVRHDLSVLSRDGLALAIFGALIASLAFAVFHARAIVLDHRAALTRHEAQVWTEQAKLEAPLQPTSIERPVILPDGPLSVLTLGRTRLDPAIADASYWSRRDLMFANYQTASPLALNAGSFDLSFVVIVIAPLLIIALGAGIIATDRDSGRLQLALAGPVAPGALLFGRVAIRAVLVAAPILIAAAAAACLAGPLTSTSISNLVLWIAGALVYLLLWQAAVALGATLRARAEAIAVGLVALWALWILAVPALIAAGAAALHPPPSRPALVADLRAVEADARDQAPQDVVRYMHDHPELQRQGDAYVADWMKTLAMTRIRVEEAIAPRHALFDSALANQHAISRAAEFVTPALALHRIFADAAGTGEARHRAFRTQAYEYKERLQGTLVSAVFRAERVPREAADRLGRFAFREPGIAKIAGASLPPLTFWLAFAVGLFVLALWRARRLSPA